ncbi:hypothetical protein Tco_0427517 [Tanacetum coccineum]
MPIRLLCTTYGQQLMPTSQPMPAQQIGYQIMGLAQQVQSGLTGSTVTSGQATILPHDFTVRTLHDPASGVWNLDTGREVLRHLVSNNFLSCNKEKPPVLCHACQLGKHVRLSFVSSNTVVTSCFV